MKQKNIFIRFLVITYIYFIILPIASFLLLINRLALAIGIVINKTYKDVLSYKLAKYGDNLLVKYSMKPTIELVFIEFTLDVDELYAEFVISKKKGIDIVLTIFLDKTTKEIRDFNIIKKYYTVEGIYTDTDYVTEEFKDKIELNRFKKAVIDFANTKDLSEDYFEFVSVLF